MIEPSITADLNFEKRWQEGIKDWNGKIPERMINDQMEESFWSDYLNKKRERSPDDYSYPLQEAILENIGEEDKVVEIGPGWGNYTFPLLEKAKELSVVDSSKSVLDFLSQKAGDQSFRAHKTKWEDFKSGESFDVVIGVNCFYRMFEIKKAILNMNRYAERLCIIGMTTGPLPPHYERLKNQYGYHIKHPRRDYIDLLHLLYECGIYADCKLVPLMRKTVYPSREEAIREGSKKVLFTEPHSKHVEETLTPYLKEVGRGFVYEQPFHGALLMWKPSRLERKESL
jgi:ubiquinone/menaquinone biosynthesis C-methylase UbiE